MVFFAWLALWNKLRVDWSTNDEYQYGWFVPPLALALLALRWADRPPPARDLQGAGWKLALLAGFALTLLLPVRLIEEPNPDWRLLFWIHAVALTALSLTLFVWIGGWRWGRHFAFVFGFLLVAVPWPSGPEQATVQSLMRFVAAISAEGMNLLGIPAVPQGNLIQIRDQMVGVNEACSGIRSLQTMLMAALLLGELSRLGWLRRLALLGGGLTLALVGNIFRCSLLVWVAARRGVAAIEQVHDIAGVSVLVIVFGGLLLLNTLLSRRKQRGLPTAESGGHPGDTPPMGACCPVPMRFLVASVVWLVFVEAGTAAWYAQAPPVSTQPARWTIGAPTDAPSFQNIKIDDRTRQILRYDEGVSEHWTRPGTPVDDCNLFFFRWEPGHASGSQAEMHQPHICLTATGLTLIQDQGVQPLPLANGITLPVRRYEFALHGRSIYVFFVAWQDRLGSQTLAEGPGSRWDRLHAVLEHRPNFGRQTLEFIVIGPTSISQAKHRFEQEIATLVRPQTGTTAVAAAQ